MRWIATILLLSALPALAATYYVAPTTSCADAYTTLTNAASGDTVWFPARESGLAWTNAEMTYDGFGCSFAVPAGVTLACSNGAIFDGLLQTRVFYMSSASTISNAVIVKGKYPSSYGGIGIYATGACVITHCIISGNTNSNVGAGGVRFIGAGGIIKDSTISSNYAGTATGGGGVYGAQQVLRCRIEYNATSGNGAGASYCSNIVSSSFVSNKATLYGGGIYSVAGASNVACYVAYNTATGGGAGIFIPAEASAHSCVIANNYVPSDNIGAGIRGGGSSYNCTVVSNVVGGYSSGGGIRQGTHYNDIIFGNVASNASPTNFADNNWSSSTYLIGCYTQAFTFATNFTPPAGSAVIDAGVNSNVFTSIDYFGLSRIYGTTVDFGAVEWRPESTPQAVRNRRFLPLLFGILE